jgi:hypothetical protein
VTCTPMCDVHAYATLRRINITLLMKLRKSVG